MEDAVLRSGEFALLHGDIASDVKIMDLDVRVREGVKPAAEELGTGRFFLRRPSLCCAKTRRRV